MVALEQNGGVWVGGAHGRGRGIIRDYEKLNLAQELGWSVGQFTPKEIKNGEAAAWVKKMIANRKKTTTTTLRKTSTSP